jgi:prophage tail gpP-like protein
VSGATDRNYIKTTNRVKMKLGGFIFSAFGNVEIARDLKDISGTFKMDCLDQVRLRQALPVWIDSGFTSQKAIDAGMACELSIDDEPVLIGWVEILTLKWDATTIACHISGRDRTGDLVECAALPDGPAEFKGVDLLHVAKQVCALFGIPVRADVDVGAPFDRLAATPHQSAMEFLESASRQRSVLLTSDGVGGLLLTRGGKTRAPAPLTVGDNAASVEFTRDFTHRFSRYIVKGQSGRGHGHTAAALDGTLAPDGGTAQAAPGPASTAAAGHIVMTGEARDPEITRYRPRVLMVRTQSGMSTVQEQAEWALRVAKGMSEQFHIPVLEWRDGPKRELWRPNQVTLVTDPYSGLNKDMLMAGVMFAFNHDGARTVVRLAGVTAFDRINEAQRHRAKGGRGNGAARSLDSSLPAAAP